MLPHTSDVYCVIHIITFRLFCRQLTNNITSCSGKDTWGSYGLTLIDALDTLYIMGEMVEFERACKVVIATLTFDLDKNVSVFETNIRIVGGLLAAHLIAEEHFGPGRSLSARYSGVASC